MPGCTITVGSALAGQQPGFQISPDSVIQWTPTDTATATTHPAEDGSNISDNITLEPRSFTASLMFTPYPSEPGLFPFAGLERPEVAFTALQQAMQRRQTFRVAIEDRVYDPCILTSLSMQRQAPVMSRLIDVAFTEVVIVQSQRAKVRPVVRLRRKAAKVRTVTQMTRADAALAAAVNVAQGRWLTAIPFAGAAVL